MINNRDLEYIDKIQDDFESLINKYSDVINNLNPEYIYDIANRLFHVNLFYEASKLLKLLIISQENFWNSPLVRIYILSLYHGQQYLQLSQFLNRIQKETWDSNIFIIKAEITSFKGNFIEAEEIIYEGLNFNKLSLTSWKYLVLLI